MNSRSRGSFGIAALLVAGVAGCSKHDPPTPQPEGTTTASERPRAATRNQMAAPPRIDPQVMKEYRLDLCYYGTFTLRQARDSYLTSLGKDEPSEKKLPSFGVSTAPAKPAGPLTPTPAASAKPAASAAAAPPFSLSPERRPSDFALRASHERNGHACSSAALLKEPAMGDVDTALAAFAPVAVDLGQNIAAANVYYQREDYKKDQFAQGKELHKKLLEGFQKLDDLHDKLGKALADWRQQHPADVTRQEGGEKAVLPAFNDARAVLLAAMARRFDPAAFKEATTKLEASINALREFSQGHADDTWAKIALGPLDVLLRSAKDAKVSGDKGPDAESQITLINNFTNLIEGRYRAVMRAAMARAQAASPNLDGPLPPGHPSMIPQ